VADKKTKLNCNLVARGSDKVEADAANDLNVPDPELATGKKVIEDAMGSEEDGKDDDDSAGTS